MGVLYAKRGVRQKRNRSTNGLSTMEYYNTSPAFVNSYKSFFQFKNFFVDFRLDSFSKMKLLLCLGNCQMQMLVSQSGDAAAPGRSG